MVVKPEVEPQVAQQSERRAGVARVGEVEEAEPGGGAFADRHLGDDPGLGGLVEGDQHEGEGEGDGTAVHG